MIFRGATSLTKAEGPPAGTGGPSYSRPTQQWLESEAVTITQRTAAPSLLSVPDPDALLWSFKIAGLRRIWDWGYGAPDPRILEPIRRPYAGRYACHNPVEAWSITTRSRIRVESGLEFDLFRELDRDPILIWIVAQPLALSVPGPRRRFSEHFPDFLTLDVNGRLKIWDVKSPDRIETLHIPRQIAEVACTAKGIGYDVFTGFETARKVNLNWIDAYRNKPTNFDDFIGLIDNFVSEGCRFGDLLEHVGHYGIPVVWHCVWAGLLRIDLDRRTTEASKVTLA